MGLMGSYHDYIPDSVVEAYYGWDVDERQHCGTCDHHLKIMQKMVNVLEMMNNVNVLHLIGKNHVDV